MPKTITLSLVFSSCATWYSCVCVYVCMYVCTCMYECMYVYVCMCVCMCIRQFLGPGLPLLWLSLLMWICNNHSSHVTKLAKNSPVSWSDRASIWRQVSTPVCCCSCVRSPLTQGALTLFIFCWTKACFTPQLVNGYAVCTVAGARNIVLRFAVQCPCHCSSSAPSWTRCCVQVFSLHKLHITDDEYRTL